jgi:para-nitrobenzyl esterase
VVCHRPAQLLSGYRKRAPGADLADLRAAFLGDAVYRMPSIRPAAAQTEAGGPAHSYLFCAEPLGPEFGAFHSAELYLASADFARTATPELLAVRKQLFQAWARFAAHGEPGWAAYDPSRSDSTRQISGQALFVTEPPADIAAIWS